MVFRTLGLLFLLISTVSYAQGRKPAVEDFVGIEVEQSEVTPQGTESLYNLEQDLNKYEAKKKETVKEARPVIAEAKGWSMTTIFGLSLVLGLPMIVWLMVMSHMKKKASLESASNIEVLEKYRKEREKKIEASIKKAS